MALNATLAEMRTNVRRFANVQGVSSLLRHPDSELNDAINRALGSLHRRLTTSLPDQRFLASTTFVTVDGQTVYGLPVGFDHLISLELTADGHKTWLQGYEMSERSALTDPNLSSSGIPLTYRLRGSNMELLPTPGAGHSLTAWYVPAASQLSLDGDTFDTIARLDDYVVAYASRLIAVKDKQMDLVAVCREVMGELESEIDVLARNRDRNSPPRIVDTFSCDRWGRSRRGR